MATPSWKHSDQIYNLQLTIPSRGEPCHITGLAMIFSVMGAPLSKNLQVTYLFNWQNQHGWIPSKCGLGSVSSTNGSPNDMKP